MRTIVASLAVPYVHQIGPLKQSRTGKSPQFISRHSFSPWNIPPSTRIRLPGRSTRYLEPVTVPAAPRNVSDSAAMSSRWHAGPVRGVDSADPTQGGSYSAANALAG